MPFLPLFSHIMANPPEIAPASAACHLFVCLRMSNRCACLLNESRPLRFSSGTSIEVAASRSNSSSSSAEPVIPRVLKDDTRMGKAFRRNLYREVKEPGNKHEKISNEQLTDELTKHSCESPGIPTKNCVTYHSKAVISGCLKVFNKYPFLIATVKPTLAYDEYE